MSLNGDQLTSLVLQKGYPTYKRDRGQRLQKVYLYAIAQSVAKNFIPDDFSQDPQGEEGYSFLSSSISGGDGPDIAMMTTIYGPIDTSSVGAQRRDVGTVTMSSSINVSERPIETHPNYVAGATSDFMTYIADNNITSYPVGTPTMTRTEVKDARITSFSESLITAGVNVQGAPAGLAGATAARWVKTGREIDSDGDLLTIRDTYEYDVGGWQGVAFGLNNT